MLIKLTATYSLTSEAHAALVLAGNQIPRTQTIDIEVDAAQAVAAGTAWITTDGSLRASDDRRVSLLSGSAVPIGRDIGWPETPCMDHVLTMDEARDRYHATLAARATALATQTADRERTRRELDAAIPQILAGKGMILDGSGSNIKMGDRLINTSGLLTDAEGDAIRAEYRRRDEAFALARREGKDAERVRIEKIAAERDQWICEHGSSRLQKALDAGLSDKMRAVYRDERVALELGEDWISWDAADEDLENDRINPSESELDALLAERARRDSDRLEIQLRTVQCEGEDNYRPALMMRLPWEIERWAVRYLDE